LQRRFRQAAVGLSGYALVGGVVSLAGWVLDLPRLTDWVGTGISIQPNTCLAVILASAGLLCLSFERRRAAMVLGAIVAVLGGSALLEWITGLDFGIDRLLLFGRTWGAGGVVFPGRMGPPGATSWTIIGGALVLASRGARERRFAPKIALVPLGLSLLSLVGYAYGASALYALPRLTAIATQTSTFIFALSLAVILSVPERSPTSRFVERSAAGTLVRRMVPIAMLLPIALGFLRLFGQRADLYDLEFGTALRTVIEIVLLLGLLWWTARTIKLQALRGEKDVRDREHLLAAVTENTRIGLVVVSPDHRYLYANQAYAEVFGLAEHEIVGRRLAEILPGTYEANVKPRLDKAFGGERVEYDLVLPPAREGDPERAFAVVYEPQVERGSVLNVIITVADVSERKRVEQALKRTSEMKDEFLSTLSHELRTPLHAILGWVRVLEKRPDDSGLVHEGIEVIARNAKAQADLIADLLDMSRIISGKIRLELDDVTLSEVIAKAIETVRPAADGKNICIETSLAPDADAVRGDAGRLQQVLWNLLSNAVKFTPKGGRIDVTLKRVESHVEIAVSDTGIGIHPRVLPHVFDRFRQGDATTTREHGGLGLGLSIVKQLVELHGGTVEGASAGVGKGATMTIRLPLALMRVRQRGGGGSGAGNAGLDDVDLEGITVLAVEDQADARELLRIILERSHARVVTAGSVDEALRVLERAKPEIILCDIGMPGKDGYDFIAELRRRKDDTPALAVTAFARAEDKIRALRAGYHGHIAKPIEPAELLTTVAVLAKTKH
jgi:PAS domain S-box-containing protein